MKLTYLLIFFLIIKGICGQVYEDASAAFKKAELTNRPALLVFSGSDWCSNCIRFNKEILSDSLFLLYASERLVLLKADFPQRIKLPEEIVRQNEVLAEKYNPEGFFPRIVLLSAKQEVVANILYTRQTSEAFINELHQLLPEKSLKAFKKRVPAMGSFFEFIIVDSIKNEANTWRLIDECVEELNRIEELISEWIPTSQVSLINQNAGISAIEVDPELYRLIERSIRIGDLTQGAFDISFQGLGELWRFDGSQSTPPDSGKVIAAIRHVDYRKIQLLEGNKVFLPEKGMAIGFGGIGQGYSVDKLKELLLNKGVKNFVINSSGDIFAMGKKADGSAWKVGVSDPEDRNIIIRWLEVEGRSVVTSGNYEKYFEYQGSRYAHIIDPKTGWPTQGMLSVTVISPVTEIADALATALFVLGKEVGLDLINQLPDTHCIIIDDKKNVSYSRDLIITQQYESN